LHDSGQAHHRNLIGRSLTALRRVGCGLVVSSLTLFASTSSFASLGGDLNSVLADQVQFQGSLKLTQMGSYQVHEIRMQTATASATQARLQTGIVIREYVSPAGKVFAVTWQGEAPPNMRQLLGSYFQQYVDAMKAQVSGRPGRRPVLIVEPDFVVQMSGRVRAYAGKAYLPGMLPSGVQPEALQ